MGLRGAEQHQMETVAPITYFRGHHRWLSNFHPCKIRIRGHEFDSVEHAYQALKFDESKWSNFKGITAKEAKHLGYKIFPGLPEEWHQMKVVLMGALLEQKFALGSELALALLATGDAELIEGNNWGDTFWGVCDGVGENQLGKLLMARRAQLQQQQQNKST